MSVTITKQIDEITSSSDSAEESLERLRVLQQKLAETGELFASNVVKEFADEWEEIISI